VKTWFNGVLRETLVDTESEESTGETVVVQKQVTENEGYRIYPRLPSDDSETDSEMENVGATGRSSQREDNAFILRELRLVQLQMKNMQEKEKSREFTQTWENNVTPDTYDPITRVRNMLEKPKQYDATMEYIQCLEEKKAAGKATENTLGELSKARAGAPEYDGKPEKVFEWCEKLEKHLRNHNWEEIPNDEVKRMLLG